jgi:hypothetical protein
MSILPIDKETIVAGTNDGGKTVHSSDATLNKKLQQMATTLNLKPHNCGGVTVYSAGIQKVEITCNLDFAKCLE